MTALPMPCAGNDCKSAKTSAWDHCSTGQAHAVFQNGGRLSGKRPVHECNLAATAGGQLGSSVEASSEHLMDKGVKAKDY